jgi:hypothetical protein
MGQGQHAISYEDALRLTEGAKDVHRVLLEHAPQRKHGGDRRSAQAKADQDSVTNLVPPRSGARKVTLAIRLAKEQPKLYVTQVGEELKKDGIIIQTITITIDGDPGFTGDT